MSSTTAIEPVVTMASTLLMVLATWSRLVPATRDPPLTRSDWTRIRFLPPGPIRVCGPGLAATLATVGDRNQATPPAWAVGGDLQVHLLAVDRQVGHVEGAGERGRLDVGRTHDLGGYGVAVGLGGLGGKGQGSGQPGQGQGQRSLQVAVGLGEQVAAHGGHRADVERDQREQRDDHHAGHHLEPQLGAEQPPQERCRVKLPGYDSSVPAWLSSGSLGSAGSAGRGSRRL